jgi:biopolymer transport protein ExbD
MAMTPGPTGGEDDPMMEMNMTPLIDVMLVLIIMLIITIPIQNHAINLNMPVGTPPPSKVLPKIVDIEVAADGSISWDGAVIADRARLDVRLKEVASQQDQPEIHLRPNKMAPYKSVAAVMASAQRLGITKIGLIGNEQFMP